MICKIKKQQQKQHKLPLFDIELLCDDRPTPPNNLAPATANANNGALHDN
jgi:hypothetical protein